MYLKNLTELNGVSGNEEKVREYICKIISPMVDEITIDSMGNLIAFKKGTNPGFKVMVAAHMDEVGLIVTGISENGTLRFKTVGGIDERILPGKKVIIDRNKTIGVIGCKPVHLQSKDEMKNNLKLKELFIDIGCTSKSEAEAFVELGDYVSYISEFKELGEDCIKAKALDDRVGCAILMELLKYSYGFDFYACFTVQEEVGLRGAEIAAFRIQPNLALVIEGTTCSDVPDAKKYEYSTILGKGAALTIMDRTSYPDKNLVRYIYELAQSNNIPVQYKQTTTGGNDAGEIQRSGSGVKVATISVPVRYIHSPVSIMSKKDYESCKSLTLLVLKDLSNNQDLIGN